MNAKGLENLGLIHELLDTMKTKLAVKEVIEGLDGHVSEEIDHISERVSYLMQDLPEEIQQDIADKVIKLLSQ